MVDYVTIGMQGTLGLQKALGTYTRVNITMIIDQLDHEVVGMGGI